MFICFSKLNKGTFKHYLGSVMPTIHISEETLERLKKIAIPFEDKEEEDVIKRLLDKEFKSKNGEAKSDFSTDRDLTSHSGRIPHGSKLKAVYKGQEYFAEIDDGKVRWKGKKYSSVSKAAVAVIQSTGSKRTTENGWRFWEVKEPGNNKWKSGLKYQSS